MTIDFKDSVMSSKNKSTLKKFENLVINEGDEGLRKISKTLKKHKYLKQNLKLEADGTEPQ